ncbi:MAG: asparagine synthase (glutamine-hydrolyzing) [Saprospiraceae bacterium]|nr:asparagine synthase (glutamine-hydrolyzing) [Saprospiraceae bacterium]
MCGIAGSINFTFSDEDVRRFLHHRGPDQQNGFQRGSIQLYHLRLAIQALSAGEQPMHYGNHTLTYNGEVYNHMDLRKQYALNCLSDSDTETLLHMLAQGGTDALVDADAMFAIAWVDWQKRQVRLIRDRAGKKPLYVYQFGKEVVWCSELRTLRRLVDASVDPQGIQQYLYCGYPLQQQTCYAHVSEVGPGEVWTIDMDTCQIDKGQWWKYPVGTSKLSGDMRDWVEEVDGVLQRSVRNRMISSDLEVGTFLSGGIDSGLVSAVAAPMVRKLKTFTVSFAGQFDESHLARMVADKYDTDHHRLEIDLSNLKNDVFEIFANYGEPFSDTSAIPSWYVSKAAKEHLTVILNGDGADELFGGYRRYVPYQYHDFLSSGRSVRKASKLLHRILRFLPASHRSSLAFLKRLTRLAAQPNAASTYLASTSDTMVGHERYFEFSTESLLQTYRTFFETVPGSISGLEKMMYTDFHWLLFGDLLVKMDIATMAHSLEGRSPFLSSYFLQLAPALPDHAKVKGVRTKVILRELAKKYLPQKVVMQPKRGFEIPAVRWINQDLSDVFQDLVLTSNALVKDYVKSSFIERIIRDNAKISPYRRAKIMWSWLALEIWHQDQKN